MDGWQVAEACRETWPGLPVIYVSANPIVENRKVAGSIFLSKPVDVESSDRALPQTDRGRRLHARWLFALAAGVVAFGAAGRRGAASFPRMSRLSRRWWRCRRENS